MKPVVKQPGIRNQHIELFGKNRTRNRNLNHLESGLRNTNENLAELSEAINDTRAMVASSLVGLSHLTNQVNRGFEANQRISERILHVSTEMRNVIVRSRDEFYDKPWKILFIYWKGLLHLTVLSWQLSFLITRNVLAIMPCPLFLCSCGCMLLECATLIYITDCALCMGTMRLSTYFGLSYELFRMFVNFALIIVPGICGRMLNGVVSYYRPYGQIISEVSGISLESFQHWRDNVTSVAQEFVGSSIRSEVQTSVEPIIDELKNMPGIVYNATSTMVSDAAASVVYDGPKAVVNSVFGKGSGAALGVAASAVPQIAANAAGSVVDFSKEAGSAAASLGSSALRKTKGLLSVGVDSGSAALGYGATVGSEAYDKGTRWFKSKMLGGGEPFDHINLLEGSELDEFNRTIGKPLVKLHKLLDMKFHEKYGVDTVLDDNALELIVFMEKAYNLLFGRLIPSMAIMIDRSRTITVEPGLRKILIESAFTNVLPINTNVLPVKIKTKSRRRRIRKTRVKY